MASIRIKKTTEPSTPPSGRSRLYVDIADDHFKRKKDDGSVVDYDIGLTPEVIQDVIGSIVTDTSTIDLTYDDVNDELRADIVLESINSTHVYEISPTKIGDAQNKHFEASLNTTNNSAATAFILDCSDDGMLLVSANITCFRTGGTSGNPGDGATFKRTFRIKTTGGVVSIHDLQSDYTSRDNNAINVEFLINLTDINFRVKGLNNNNFRWKLDISVNKNN